MKDEKYVKLFSEAKEVDIKKIINTVIETNWSKDNSSQMKNLELMKGIALSDEPEANAFMKKIDNFTSGLDKLK